jgi:hypothetical protein
MHHRRRLALRVAVRDIEHVGLAVPRHPYRRRRMVPAEIDAGDLRPMARDREGVARHHLVGDGEDAARAELRRAVGARASRSCAG